MTVVNAGTYRSAYARVEKPRQTNDLRNGHQRAHDQDARHFRQDRFMRLSQSETAQAGAAWTGPELNAAFVAQLLGQVMPAPTSAPLRYGKPAPAWAPLFLDTRC